MRARVQPIMAGLMHLYLHELRQGQKGELLSETLAGTMLQQCLG